MDFHPTCFRSEHAMNLIFLLILGGLIGLLADQVMLSEGQNTITRNVIVGAVGAAIGGWLMQPVAGASALLGAALGSGLFLSVVNLMRGRGIP